MLKIQSSFEVERVHRPSREEFERRFIATQTPAVITGAMEDWPAMERWSNDYLRTKVGHRTIDVSVAHDGMHFGRRKILDFKSMKMSEYLDRMEAGQILDGRLYMIQTSLRTVLPELLGDICYPPYFSREGARDPNVWYGPGGNTAPLHYDPNPNILAHIRGHKKVYLYPPGEIHNLYPFPLYHRAAHVSRINTRNPDLARFSDYDKARGAVVELEPGDMVYIPLFWWHVTFGSGQNISVNFWWKNRLSDFLPYPNQAARVALNRVLFAPSYLVKELKALWSGMQASSGPPPA